MPKGQLRGWIIIFMFKDFRDLLHSTYKSYDTEENIDIYFTRPIGLFFALIWKRLGVHPNAITVLSFFAS